MKLPDFERLFSDPVIRVEFSWDRFRSGSRYHVTTTALVLPGDGESLLAPWYRRSDGSSSDYSDPSAAPVRLARIPELLEDLEDRRAKITHLAELLANRPPPVQLVAPLFPVGDDFLVLDGNHRIAAAFHQGCEVRLLGAVVRGPADPALIPDLWRWT